MEPDKVVGLVLVILIFFITTGSCLLYLTLMESKKRRELDEYLATRRVRKDKTKLSSEAHHKIIGNKVTFSKVKI